MPEQLAADPRDERHRHEHREQNESDRDDRAGDLGHCLLGRCRDRQLGLFLDDPLDVLDHDDRIVDHNADREHQREQRHGIGRIADDQHDREGADDRHGNRDERDQGRAQLAEKQKDDDPDQHERDHKRADDLLDGRGHEDGGVPEGRVGDVIREALLQLIEGLAHMPRHLDRVGAR